MTNSAAYMNLAMGAQFGPVGERPTKDKANWISIASGLGMIAMCLIGLFTSGTVAVAGLWTIGLMLVLMFLGLPVAIALALPSVVGIYAISGTQAASNVLSTAPYNSVSSWSMSVLPMFIFMAMLLTQSGLVEKMYRAANQWFSWLPGGMGVGTTAAGAGLASVSGSTIGMTYALGKVGIPEMLKLGYDKRIAIGTVIVAGLPGSLIPPSILLVIYASIASVPVGPQLAAGAVPGILIALMFATFLVILGFVVPHRVGRREARQGSRDEAPTTLESRLHALRDVWGIPVVLLVLFGGMFSGFFTPTEAGAGGALIALLLTLWLRRRDSPLQQVSKAAISTISATAAIFFVLVGAEMLTRVLAVTGLATMLTQFVTDLGLSRVTFLLALIPFYIVLGMFFDTLAMLLLTVPILLPTLEAMEVSPLWFGVFVILLGELGMITPPAGILSYIIYNITKSPEVNQGQRISLGDVFMSLVWFLPVAIVFLVLMVLFPGMAEWLPELLT
ncbi:TRAP transporter large permease [Nesterenkonia populi]|uniref:TRAP transporter large permease n=1 Tax=Nesterenkonia populi TaxID=1591087 RepID=UPI0011BDA9EF|nr:TRAP transporter large permease [Nesterenkonia populi]